MQSLPDEIEQVVEKSAQPAEPVNEQPMDYYANSF